MINTKEQLHIAHVSSAEELKERLPDISLNGMSTHYVSLSVSNPEIRVNPFHLEGIEKKEIRHRLLDEAVEAMSLPADAIELDYRLFDSPDEHARGVYVSYPKQILQDYLKGVDRSGYIPVKIVPSILAGIDSFLDQYKETQGRFCLFDFSRPEMVYFAVFSNGCCDYLRQIVCEGDDDVEHEVIQSLRSACAISHIKKFDQIFFSGDVPHKEAIFKKVKDLFCDNVTHGFLTNVEASLRRPVNAFALNLIKDKTFTLGERKMINKVMLGVVGAGLLIILALAVNIVFTNGKIKKLEESNSLKDYNYALDLQKRLKEIK